MAKIQKCIKILSILAILGFTILGCEQADEALGYGLLNNDVAAGLKRYVNLISYNLYNGDSIRSDRNRLQDAVVGVYEEDVFGKVRASYVTQVRLPVTNFQFSDSIEGGNPKATVDSVVFYFTPQYSTDADEVEVDTIYVDENGNPFDVDDSDDVDTFKIVTKYPITSKYGDAASTMNLDIHTINEFLYSTDSAFYSNKTITNDVHLGSGLVQNFVVGIQYKNSQSTIVDSINGNDVNDITPSVRIPLDINYFQTRIIDEQGSLMLQDQSRFIQYLKGIKISTPDENAFMLTMSPSNLQLRMYYSYVKKKDFNGDIEEGNTSFLFNLANNFNVRIGLFDRDASLSPYLTPYVSNTNSEMGDAVLFLDGLGGFKTIIAFDEIELQQLKSDFQNNNLGIIGANLKFYKHPLCENLIDAPRIFGYVYKNTTLPNSISEVNYDDFEFLSDIYAFAQYPGFVFNPNYDSSLDYYQINITEYVKNIVEKDSINYPLIVEMGTFATTDIGSLFNVNYTNKPYNPNRVVFKGNSYGDEENLKLEILYTEN